MNLMFWKKKKPSDESGEDGDKTEAIAPPPKDAAAKPAPETGDEAASLAVKRIRNKKRMILAAMAGGAVLLLAAIGITAWMLLSSPEKKEETSADQAEHTASEDASKPGDGEHGQDLQTQLDELRKQNEKLAAELEAVKKGEPAEQASTGEPGVDNEGAAKKANEITFSSQDPKGSAQALKQAIEQMNAEDKRGQGK